MTHNPTNEQRKTVEALAGYGVPELNIASVIGIDPKTLRKHYRHELDTAFITANARVAQSLFKMATEGQNVAAAIFWMKARAKWTEKQSIEVTTLSKLPEHVIDTLIAAFGVIDAEGLAGGRASEGEDAAATAKADTAH